MVGKQIVRRQQVLDELKEHDPAWAARLELLRSTDPPEFRKAILRADVMLAARLGRATTLRRRPRRLGGDEDPALVRRVQELRKQQRLGGAPPVVLPQAHGTTTEAPSPATADAPVPHAPAEDLSVLDGSVGDIKKALASGALDELLDALMAAEQAGKARKGVLSALQARSG